MKYGMWDLTTLYIKGFKMNMYRLSIPMSLAFYHNNKQSCYTRYIGYF